MKAIILAAGINSRLNGYIDIPKCLLPLWETTILENQINALIKAGLRKEDIIVVVGHKYEMIENVHKNILFNPKFSECNNGYSVYLALNHLLYGHDLKNDEKILILDGDLVYDDDLILKLNLSDKENLLVKRPIKYSRELKDEVSVVNDKGKILELFIPSKENPLDLSYSDQNLYSYVGIMKISKNVALQLYEKLKTSYHGWYTLPLPELVQSNDFYCFEVPENLKYCFDVDTKEDLDKLLDLKNKLRKPFKMFTAGPVNVSPTIKQSLIYSEIGHRESEFSELYKDVREKLLLVFGANSVEYSSFVIGGSGTAGMESVLASAVHNGRKILVINNGAFGDRWAEICSVYNIPVIQTNYEWGQYPNINEIERLLIQHSDIEVICMVFMETSTGMVNPVKEIGDICKKYNKTFVVDAVSGLAGDPLNVQESNIDFCVSNTNKGFSGLPVISFVCARKSSIEKMRDVPKRTFYLNLLKYYDYAEKSNETPFTPQIPYFYMLQQALNELLKETLESRYKRYKENSSLMRARLAELRFKFQLSGACMSNVMTNVLIPKNYHYEEFHMPLKKKGYIIYPGKGPLVDKILHIANVGTHTTKEVSEFCDAIAEIVKEKRLEY